MPIPEMIKIHKEKGIPMDDLEKFWGYAKHAAGNPNNPGYWAIVQTIFKKKVKKYLNEDTTISFIDEFIKTRIK